MSQSNIDHSSPPKLTLGNVKIEANLDAVTEKLEGIREAVAQRETIIKAPEVNVSVPPAKIVQAPAPVVNVEQQDIELQNPSMWPIAAAMIVNTLIMVSGVAWAIYFFKP